MSDCSARSDYRFCCVESRRPAVMIGWLLEWVFLWRSRRQQVDNAVDFVFMEIRYIIIPTAQISIKNIHKNCHQNVHPSDDCTARSEWNVVTTQTHPNALFWTISIYLRLNDIWGPAAVSINDARDQLFLCELFLAPERTNASGSVKACADLMTFSAGRSPCCTLHNLSSCDMILKSLWRSQYDQVQHYQTSFYLHRIAPGLCPFTSSVCAVHQRVSKPVCEAWVIVSNPNYGPVVTEFLEWCELSFLDINANNTKEMVVNFSVQQYKYLGITIDDKLTFEPHVDTVCKKAHQCIHFFS